MPTQLPIRFTMGALIEGSQQSKQQYADEIAKRLLGYVEETILRGKMDGSEPTTDEGLWINNDRFYNWNATRGDYEVIGYDFPIRPAGLYVVNDGGSPNTSLNITAEAIPLRNPDSGSVIMIRDVSITSDISLGAIANGLGPGLTEQANTWYHNWLLSNGTSIQTRLGISYTSPPVVSGYPYNCYLGPVRNDGSSNLRMFHQLGRVVSENIIILTDVTATTLDVYQDCDVSATNVMSVAVPVNAISAHLQVGASSTYVASMVSSNPTGMFESFQIVSSSSVGANGWSAVATPFWQPILTPQKLWIKSVYSLYHIKMVVVGFRF